MSVHYDASDALDSAVRDSIASGVTYVIAAGNEGVAAGLTSPQRVSEAIIVGATTSTDERAVFEDWGSNYGTLLDLFGPGVGVLSAYYTSDTATAYLSGTSMAAPHVAGVVARYLQAHPSDPPAAVEATLTSNATDGVVGNPGAGSPNRLLFTGFLDEVVPPPPPCGGRYKLDGEGGCYWDPNDCGPNQCIPCTGRWKDDGNGGCYWDPNDCGPNQCNPTLAARAKDTPGGAHASTVSAQRTPATCASSPATGRRAGGGIKR